MRRLISRSPGQARRIAANILKTAAQKKLKPIILALTGELGSGKTTFIQGLAKTLGIREKIQSPTFVLMKRYRLPRASSKGSRKRFHQFHQFQHFIHIDAYRIERAAEARHLGLKEIFKDQDAIIVVEWAERLRELIPKGAIWIQFQHKSKNSRIISFIQ